MEYAQDLEAALAAANADKAALREWTALDNDAAGKNDTAGSENNDYGNRR